MKAAVSHEFGASPDYRNFQEPQAVDGRVIIDVEAAGLNHLDLPKASGEHYLTSIWAASPWWSLPPLAAQAQARRSSSGHSY